MNLVKLISEQFSDETLARLSQQLGTDQETVSASTAAAVPTLLSGLAALASRGDGAKKLTDVLSGIDATNLGNLAGLLGGDTGALLQRGSGLLSSLFGGSMIDTAAGAISRYSGISIETARKMLAMLVPLVLGKVAAQWRSQGGTASALTSLFAEQKRNIADAVPAGFSLPEIPGLAGAGDAVRGATQSARRATETAGAAGGSAASWILPLAVLIVGGLLLWQFLKPRAPERPVAGNTKTDAATTTVMKPVVPDATAGTLDMARVTDDMKGILTSFTSELATIKDAASADAALPKLQEMKTKLDTLHATWAKIPETARTTLRQIVSEQMAPLKERAEQTIAIPGIGDRVKALIQGILERLAEMMQPPAATPSPAN